LRRHLSPKIAYALTRWKNVLLGMLFFWLSRLAPRRVGQLLIAAVRRELGPDYDVETHFSPRYNPWDQRVCLVPNADLFQAIRDGRASVVTDHIDTFTEQGLTLRSGAALDADLIVTATGLQLKVLGGVQITVDGEHVDLGKTTSYKGMMYSDVPNLASCFGYTNASWTLKCDLTCLYVCRLLNHLEQNGYRSCTPRIRDPAMPREPFLDFSSGYVRRSIDAFPKQGEKAPWKLYQNYALDTLALRFGAVEDGSMEFSAGRAKTSQ
jgi:cation diffusion facilitator CzcD-associated flavoprotein CzcO